MAFRSNLGKSRPIGAYMEKTHISNVSIKRFKGLKDVSVDLDEFNVFIGSNNSGKSSIIQALHFLISILQSSNLVRPWDKVDTSSISPDQIIYSPARDPYALATGGRLVESKAAESDIVLGLELSNGAVLETHIRKGKNNNISVSVNNQEIAAKLSALDSPFSIFSPGLAGLAKSEPLQSDGLLLRALARGDANVILRNILFRLSEKPAEMHSFLDDLRLVFPGLEIEVDFDQKIDEFIDIFIHLDHGKRIPLELAGTGLLQAIQILAYIHLYSPNLIVLDEPDSHLHPNNQRALCSVLSEMVAARGTQIVMTTHSRHVLDATLGRSKIFWVQTGDVKEATINDSVDVLLDMGALDVKEYLANSQPEVLIVTEDSIIRPLELLVSANNKKNKKVAIKSYFGVKAVDNTRSLIQAIRAFSKAKIIVHRDRDYMSEADVDAWKKAIREAGATPFVTAGTDVESYFTNSQHLSEINVSLAPLEAEQLRAEAIKSRLAAMKEKAINWRFDFAKKSKGVNINVGKIAGEIEQIFAGAEREWLHGKEMVAGLRDAAINVPGGLNVYELSTHLSDEELSKALTSA